VADDFGAGAPGVRECCTADSDVLDEGAVAPDVERLGSVADGEDGLRMLCASWREVVDVVAGRIGCGGAGMRSFAVFLRIDIGGRAGKQDAVADLASCAASMLRG